MDVIYFHFCQMQGENRSSGEKTKEREMANCLYILKGNKNKVDYKPKVNTKIK